MIQDLIVLIVLVFISSNFYLSTNDIIVCNNVKLCNCSQFYSLDYISTCNELYETCLPSQLSFLTISELKAINKKNSFYRFILILSGDISLNPGPIYDHHLPKLKNAVKIKLIHLLYVNVKSLLSKIDELRYIWQEQKIRGCLLCKK